MKCCANCNVEIFTLDGDNLCGECEMNENRKNKRNAAAKTRRREMAEVMESLGLKRVKGACGGVYYE